MFRLLAMLSNVACGPLDDDGNNREASVAVSIAVDSRAETCQRDIGSAETSFGILRRGKPSGIRAEVCCQASDMLLAMFNSRSLCFSYLK